MPALRDRYRMITAKPALGGLLITRGSSDNAGTFNYTLKRDWRRELDVEIRREGHDYFYPNLSLPVGGQPFPSQITLDSLTFSGGEVTATRISGQWFEDGETIIIAGASDPIYNGTFTISDVTATTFKYAVTGTPAANTSLAITATSVEEINLIAMARRPNGQVATIAGSKRRLYRYYALEDGDYISRDPDDYPTGTASDQLSYWSDGTLFPADQMPPQAPGFWTPAGLPVSQMQYVDTNPGYWIVIGSGFSTAGNRWEIVNINGWMVFNNGVDLLCTYRVEEMEVVPIYELREQGILSVGTISEINGILMIGDLTELPAAKLEDWFGTAGWTEIDSLTYAGGVAQATIAAGHSFVVGSSVVIKGAAEAVANGNFYITAVTATTFDYDIASTPTSPDTSTSISVAPAVNTAPYGIYTGAYAERTTFRIGWGTPGFPRKWATVYSGSIAAGSNVLTLTHPILGLAVGQNITIVGAGTPHAGGTADNLTANIIYNTGQSLILDAFAGTTNTDATFEVTDEIGSIVGYEDLQDDGSGILKMLPLADQLVIYKDTSIFIGQYIGNPDQPFAFAPRRIQKEQSIFYRHTLALAETPTEMFHIYAGRNAFYRFDLANQQPMVLPKFENCSNIFFDQATLSNTERIFATENGITHEIVFVFPSTTADKALAWDYKWDTLATTSAEFTSAATVRKPLAGLAHGAEEDWFVMGTGRGAVLIYGLTNIPQATPDWNDGEQIFFRRDANPYSATKGPYDSNIQDGMGAFGNEFGEKDLRAIVALMGSQSPNTEMTIKVFGAQNVDGTITHLGTKVFTNIVVRNLLPIAARRLYFSTETIVSGIDNPCRRVGLIWSVAQVDSRSITRG